MNLSFIGKILLCVLFLASLGNLGCKENKTVYPSRTLPDTIASSATHIANGHRLFLSKCASCHGKPSEGRSDRASFFAPPAPDFTDGRYKRVDPGYLYWRIETGKTVEPFKSEGSVMPAWGAYLSDEQIWQLVSYLLFRAH